MKRVMAQFVNEGKKTWTATFVRFGQFTDNLVGETVDVVVLKDIKDSQGNIISYKLKLRKNEAFDKFEENLSYGDTICFTGEVKGRRHEFGANYYIEGVNNVIIFDPSLINPFDFKESVYNLRKEKYTIKQIACLLDSYTDKILRVIRENEELKEGLSEKQKCIINTIQYYLEKGNKPKWIAAKIGISIASYYTYRPYAIELLSKAA